MKNQGSKQVISIILTIIVLNTSLSGCEKQQGASDLIGAE